MQYRIQEKSYQGNNYNKTRASTIVSTYRETKYVGPLGKRIDGPTTRPFIF